MTDYIAKAEQDTLAEILTWVQEVVEGRGQSISQLIVTVVLGCVPGVGQAVDVYNILRALYQLTRNNEKADNWIELVLCLIALVPVFGDALKNVFRMLRSGKSMGRILDSLPTKVRGNIEAWFRQLNWAAYTAELIGHANRILDGLIDLLGGRVARWVLDTKGLQRLIAQLKALKGKASQKITEAMDSLKHAHQQAMMQPLPNTTAHVPARPSAPPRPAPGSKAPAPVPAPKPAPSPPKPSTGPTSPAPRTTPSTPAKKPADTPSNRSLPANTGGTAAPRQGQATGQQRQSERSQQSKHQLGVSGEHIADYFFVRRQTSRKKVNNLGRLYEMRQPNGALTGGHQGIDHVWHSTRLPLSYRISDTKGTGKGLHKLETPKRVFEALQYGVDVYLGEEDETRLKRSLNKPTVSDGRQLSHLWIARKIKQAKLQEMARELSKKIDAWERTQFKLGSETSFKDGTLTKQLVRCPYDRSLITVVGPNHNLHDRTKGMTTPHCIKAKISHQIGTEFVIPTDLLRE